MLPGHRRQFTPRWPFTPGVGGDILLRQSFDLLRQFWALVPAGFERVYSADLLKLPEDQLLARWSEAHRAVSTGAAFAHRGWYHTLYKDAFRDKKILDFGCGLGMDTIFYAEHGARVTFVDLVESNVEVVRRICQLKRLSPVDFCYMEDLSSLRDLPTDYDVICCVGSLITAPLEVARLEAQELLKHLPVGGRWIEFGYPRTRWEREGRMPFDRWGEKTDGGAPWIEWHDLVKVRAYLAPAVFDVVLELEFHHGDFIWFDLIRRPDDYRPVA